MVLDVVRPAAVQAAHEAAVQLQEQADGQRQRMLDEVTQLQYEAERMRRQYDRVEPENRLVAAELERCWNEALQQVAAAEARWERFREESSQRVSEDDLRRLSQLGQQLERVWDASDTDPSIKKQIVRLLVREITADVDDSRGEVELWVHWWGGHHTVLGAPRGGRRGLSAAQEAKAVIGLLRAVCDDTGIAHALNRNSLSSRTKSWTAAEVRRVRQQHGIAPFSEVEKQRQGLLTQEEAARELEISPMSVHRLVHRGILPAQQVAPGFPSIIRRSDLALEEVQEAVHLIHSSLPRPLPDDPSQLKLF
jgi:hypothetical protein